MRAYGVRNAKRATGAPEIPTIAEEGLPGYEADQWCGLVAPAGTVREIIANLHASMVRALQERTIKERFLGEFEGEISVLGQRVQRTPGLAIRGGHHGQGIRGAVLEGVREQSRQQLYRVIGSGGAGRLRGAFSHRAPHSEVRKMGSSRRGSRCWSLIVRTQAFQRRVASSLSGGRIASACSYQFMASSNRP